MNKRKINILIHRYLGYYFFALTVVYAISGVAVNHIEDWNPNYFIEKKETKINPLKDFENISDQEIKLILSKLEIEKNYNPDNVFYPSENNIEILLSQSEKIIINNSDLIAKYESIQKRPVIHLFNFLHLNTAKKFWSFYADFYAISLLIIAITGMFMKKGTEGIWGKGGILAILGIIIPAIFVFMYY